MLLIREQNETLSESKMRTIDGDDDSYDEINKAIFTAKTWANDVGQIHRDGDLPAVIWADCEVWYYKDGKLHRDGDLPAIIWPDGYVLYYKNGKLHRDGDLPAIIWPDGSMKYYKNGVSYKFVDWRRIIRDVVISFILSIILLSLAVFLTHKYTPPTISASQNSTQH